MRGRAHVLFFIILSFLPCPRTCLRTPHAHTCEQRVCSEVPGLETAAREMVHCALLALRPAACVPPFALPAAARGTDVGCHAR